jgi:hypothetical protein
MFPRPPIDIEEMARGEANPRRHAQPGSLIRGTAGAGRPPAGAIVVATEAYRTRPAPRERDDRDSAQARLRPRL